PSAAFSRCQDLRLFLVVVVLLFSLSFGYPTEIASPDGAGSPGICRLRRHLRTACRFNARSPGSLAHADIWRMAAGDDLRESTVPYYSEPPQYFRILQRIQVKRSCELRDRHGPAGKSCKSGKFQGIIPRSLMDVLCAQWAGWQRCCARECNLPLRPSPI